MSYKIGYDLSSYLPVVSHTGLVLADNTVAPTGIPQLAWLISANQAVSMLYTIRRGALPEVECGLLTLVIRENGAAEYICEVIATQTTPTPPATNTTGVAFSTGVSFSSAIIKYTTTSTGSNATLDVIVLKVWAK